MAGTIDVALPPGVTPEQASKRLKYLMDRAKLSEEDALTQLKWEYEPHNRVEPYYFKEGTSTKDRDLETIGEVVKKRPAISDSSTLGEVLGTKDSRTDVMGGGPDMRTIGEIMKIPPSTPIPKELGPLPLSKPLDMRTIGEVLAEPSIPGSSPKTFDIKNFPIETIQPDTESWAQRFAGTWGPTAMGIVEELARFGGSTALASAIMGKVTAGSIAAAPATGGASLLAIPALAGTIYAGSKVLENVIRGRDEYEMTLPELAASMVAGQEVSVPAPQLVRPLVDAAEAALFAGGGAEFKRLMKETAIKAHKASQWAPLKPYTDWTWKNIVVKPFKLPVPYIGKNLQEVLQSASERIREKLPREADTIRRARVWQSLVKEPFDNLRRLEPTLLPTEKIELMRELAYLGRGGPNVATKSKVVQDAMLDVSKAINSLKAPQMKNTLLKDLNSFFSKPLEMVESKTTPASLTRLFRFLENPLVQKGQWKEKDLHNILRDVIRNPRFTPEIQQFSKDMWNLSYNIPTKVAEAAKDSSTEYIISKLMKTSGLISSKQKPGYVMSKHPSLQVEDPVSKLKSGLWVNKDIELELEAMRKVPVIAQAWMNKWFMSPWKTSKLVLRPATHARNLIGNAILNDWGGLSPWRVDIYYKALKEMFDKGPIYREWKSIMGTGGRWGKEEMNQLIPALKYEQSTIFHKGLNLFDHIAAPGRNLYDAEETWFKLAKYIHNREIGMGKLESAYDAMKWTFNYSEITPFTARMRTYAMPFYTWQSKVLPLFAETVVKHPLRIAKYPALYMYMQAKGLENVGLKEEEYEQIHSEMPDYLRNGLFLLMPWRDEKKQLKLLNLTWMIPGIGDLSEIYQRGATNPFTLVLQHPLIGAAVTLYDKRKFSGAPLYYDWESSESKLMKQLAFMWEVVSPPVLPGNTDWNLIANAIRQNPEALTPEEAIASQVGFKFTSIDPIENQRRYLSLQRIHESEMSTEMRKELKKAKTPEEIDEILEFYRDLRFNQPQYKTNP